MDTSVPVVVLACGYAGEGWVPGYGPLGVARSLGRLGVSTYVIRDKGLTPMPVSRYWKRTFTWDLSTTVGESTRFLLDIARRIGSRPILLHTTDRTAVFVAENASALDQAFVLAKVPPSVIRSLTNKWHLSLLAKEHGIPTPETVFPRSREEVQHFITAARFPIMLKGANPLLPYGKTKEIVHTARELLEEYDRSTDAGAPNLMLQEYIPGGDDAVWMCNAYFDQRSECLAAFTGKKIRQWPAYAGVASLAVCLGNDAIERATRQLMKAVGYQGLVGIGYRYDARDGSYKVLDVNPRVSAVFRLFVTANGMDVVRICYLDLTGQPIPPLAPVNGRKWILEEDIFSSLRYRRDGKLTFRQWVNSLRGVRETAWFARDDPLPFLVWCWKRFGKWPRS